MVFNKTEHGGDIYDKKIRYDFSVNINPLGTPETVRQAVIDSAKDICSYPDPCCRELINSLAEYNFPFSNSAPSITSLRNTYAFGITNISCK